MSDLMKALITLENLGGLTLKGYKEVAYKTGYQVADHGVECHTAEEAVAAIVAMAGNAGVWLENGVFYIDHSFRVKTKREALAIGRECNQTCVLKWATMELVYC